MNITIHQLSAPYVTSDVLWLTLVLFFGMTLTDIVNYEQKICPREAPAKQLVCKMLGKE